MKHTLFATVLVLSFVVLTSTVSTSPGKNSKTGKSMFFIQTPHTKEECMNVMDAMTKEGKQLLSKCYWGCMSGDHTGYAVVGAKDEDAARKMIPEMIRSKAKIMKVDNFTAAQIATFHKH